MGNDNPNVEKAVETALKKRRCFAYDKGAAMMCDESEVICKPFKKHHAEQLKLISSFDWIDFSALADVGNMIMEILSDKNAKDYMEENRIRVNAC
ncbi:MAG: hypothetical protein K6F76_05895 [Clostridiales bacterium]|nr:hypothetical protein [Clostridiales bacterium]